MKRSHSIGRGQAMTEYLIVLSFTVAVLILSSLGKPSPIDMLMDALKSFYAAFSYAISVSV